MSCDHRFDSLPALIHGGLDPAEREALLRHLEQCDGCRGLFAALAEASRAPADDDLVDSILARTSGPTCERAIELLPDRLDGALDPLDAELVNTHLRRCPACAEFATILERAQAALPRLAEAHPGPGFVEGVLARTSRRPKPAAWTDPIHDVLARLAARRRIAWEGAFVATCCLALPMAVPGSPLAAIPARALGVVREAPRQPVEAIDRLRDCVADAKSPVARQAAAVLDSTGDAVVRVTHSVWSGISQHSSTAWNAVSRSFGTFVESVASGETTHDNDSRPAAPGPDQEKNR